MSSTGGTSTSTTRSFGIYFWIYAGLILGALASVSANVAYTYIPPHVQPPWWPQSRVWDPAAYIPPVGNVVVAAFCPVAIFILTEVITRPRWRDGKLSFIVRLTSTVMVGLPVAVASYLHLCSLLEYYSTIPFIAYTLPLTVDGLMLACTAALQLTGPKARQEPADADSSREALPAAADTPVSRPRPPLDDVTAVSVAVPPHPGQWPNQNAPVPAPPYTDAHKASAVGAAGHRNGNAVAQADQSRPSPTPPVDVNGASDPPVSHRDEHRPDRYPLARSPVSLVEPPAGATLLSLKLIGPPPPRMGLGGGRPCAIKPTGDRSPEMSEGVPRRPVPYGRLGTSDLADAAITALAEADNPYGKITGTSLRRDFGVGPGRAGRLRDQIARQRLARRLADGLRQQIEWLRSVDPPGLEDLSEPPVEESASTDPADRGDSIKSSSQLPWQGS